MSRSIVLGLLRSANTGQQILRILEGLVESSDDSVEDSVEF